MRITTLGTSHGDHTYCRFNSSTLYEIGDQSYLVDCGEPVNGLMIRANKPFGQLQAVFVTHMHEDHVGGLPDLIKALVKRPRTEGGTTVFLPEVEAQAGLDGWLRAMHVAWPSPVVTFGVTTEGPVYDDSLLSVAAVPTEHMAPLGAPSFAYVLEAEGKRIVTTGDLRGDFADFPEVIRQERCDLCICEITHYKPEVALPLLMACPIDRLILNHVHDPWHGEGEARLRAIMADLPYPVEIAHDGDEFTL
ncbi:MAG: ribonuclease Z [Lentisphaerae bacterium]|nr:ribonuclease Z [Lentisphaerota bacterium]MBT4821493.1 ribonuclease Z [Lentisphaerota bacterium]MBT5605144.1 ribonuclease Z [Lentisphaerota bacterium]MBT7060680.1 ribonuclease Z [Lentisphaerota bacterium]MBT7840241.1 ribonuclease Z [Lentisphaerota bacterium]